MSGSAPVLLFDGECSFCRSSVRFFLDHERSAEMRFASLQSGVGRALLRAHGVDPERVRSVVLIESGRAFQASTASLRAARYLRAPWSWVALLLWTPRFARDAVYGVVSRARHRLSGAGRACRVGSGEERARFLDGCGGGPG